MMATIRSDVFLYTQLGNFSVFRLLLVVPNAQMIVYAL